MSHDIEDLLELIKMLEERILELEARVDPKKFPIAEDSWYWEHG